MKFNGKDFNNIWFTSDWHLQQDRPFIVQDRGFNSIEEHDDFIISEFNRLVTKDDIVFNMGDFIFGTPDECKSAIDKIKIGTQYYMIGNHDSALKLYFRYFTKNNKHNMGNLKEMVVTDNDGERYPITLTHYAMMSWNKSHYGAWNICGHSHGSLPESLPDHGVGKRCDVGVDVGLKFNDTFMFTFEDLKGIMSTKIIAKYH